MLGITCCTKVTPPSHNRKTHSLVSVRSKAASAATSPPAALAAAPPFLPSAPWPQGAVSQTLLAIVPGLGNGTNTLTVGLGVRRCLLSLPRCGRPGTGIDGVKPPSDLQAAGRRCAEAGRAKCFCGIDRPAIEGNWSGLRAAAPAAMGRLAWAGVLQANLYHASLESPCKLDRCRMRNIGASQRCGLGQARSQAQGPQINRMLKSKS